MNIRLAAPGEERLVARLHVAARQAAYAGLLSPSALARESVEGREALWRTRLRDPRARCWLLEGDDAPVGFAFTGPAVDDDLPGTSAELISIYLLREVWGRGHGRRLMSAALADLADQGYREVVLWYAVENQRAGGFYRAMGFAEDSRMPRAPFGDTGLTQERLARPLPQPPRGPAVG